MSRYRIGDATWDEISKELKGIGRKPTDGDRSEIDMYCEFFRNSSEASRPAPKRNASQWNSAAKAADKPLAALNEIKASKGNANVNAIAQTASETDELIERLMTFSHRARVVSHFEGNAPRASNNTSQAKDYLATSVIRFWVARGGKATRSTDWTSNAARALHPCSFQ